MFRQPRIIKYGVALVGVATAAAVGLPGITQRPRFAFAQENDHLDPELIEKHNRKKQEALRNWELNHEQGRVFRKAPKEIEKDRKVIVLVGITGAGKSSTANTLSGRTERSGDRFELSNSVVSVTSSAAFRDYEFMGQLWRVIDTPGLKDTNTSQQATLDELARIAEFAPNGVSAFIVVIPHGRFTEENSLAVQHLRNILATANPEQKDAINDYFIVAVTSCRQRRDALVDDINKLPVNHFLRKFLHAIDYRIIPVENRITELRQVARMQLHQRIMDVADKNPTAYNVDRWLQESSSYSDVLKARSVFPNEVHLENGRCTSKLNSLGARRVRIVTECDYDIKVEN